MAYYFMVERKNGQYSSLCITNKSNAYTLNEIDNFTMLFNNGVELRNHLINDGILPIQYANNPLFAARLHKGKYLKVDYDFLYKKDMKFMSEPVRLMKLIINRYCNNEFIFVKMIANHFINLNECSRIALKVSQLCDERINHNYDVEMVDGIDKEGASLVLEMLKLIIFKHFEKQDGSIGYLNVVKYHNLHDLVAFINDYDLRENAKRSEFSNKIETQSNVKTRKRKK